MRTNDAYFHFATIVRSNIFLRDNCCDNFIVYWLYIYKVSCYTWSSREVIEQIELSKKALDRFKDILKDIKSKAFRVKRGVIILNSHLLFILW